jgi:hypothetical protein
MTSESINENTKGSRERPKRRKRNHQWERVKRTSMDGRQAFRTKRNDAVFKSDRFKKICENLNIEPTRRQASKYARKRGLAYTGIR